ncbi:MAG: hypothetical protein BAJATHORv1_60097 [Candidatus Thorarchaeota archaeon]|nr:MAG: hypothetical protein BAJATHORv1_60097 [Candidatus Thorarchaeota archaeon]
MTEDTVDGILMNTILPVLEDVDDISKIEEIIETCSKDEVKILRFLFEMFRKDQRRFPINQAGWRNKYRIHLGTDISQKKIYSENGPIESLMELNLLEIRDSPNRWGGQKYNYRIHVTKNMLSYFE